jgi:RNA polymerase sigma-70 factor (ECF subfamily)
METVLTAPRALDNTAELTDFDRVALVHRPAIYRFLLASLRDPDTAENLTQDCLWKAYQARAGFRGEASVKTWMMQIAVNLLRNHATNARLRFWERTKKSGVDAALAADWLADAHSSPESAAANRQMVAAVWSAAEKLPERQRTVFLLRFVEDMDILEIAAACGMKEGTVKAHLFRALESVRSRLEGIR